MDRFDALSTLFTVSVDTAKDERRDLLDAERGQRAGAVTNAQYVEFLNAKAASDPHGLYNTNMANFNGGIVRSGSDGSRRNTLAFEEVSEIKEKRR